MLNFLKFIGWLISWPFFAVMIAIEIKSCVVAGKRYFKDKTTSTDDERYEKVGKLVKHLLYWKHIAIEVKDNDKISNKTMLFVVNHKSNIDPLIVLNLVLKQNVPYPTFIAKSELKDKWIGWIACLLDVIFIDRKDIRQLPAVIEKTIEKIQNKRSVCVFLEGTRVMDPDKLGEFNSSILDVAYRTHCSIQPLVLVNTLGLLEKPKLISIKPYVVDVEIMKNIPSSKFITVNRSNFCKNLHDIMQDEYTKIKNKVNK